MGDHYLLDLFGCNPRKLDDEGFIRGVMEQAIWKGNLTLLNMVFHKFEPQGITAIFLLSESHISIHTWPENGTAAVDVYTCGEKADPMLVCEYIKTELNASSADIKNIKRG